MSIPARLALPSPLALILLALALGAPACETTALADDAPLDAPGPVAPELITTALGAAPGAVAAFTGDWRVELGAEPLLADGPLRILYDPSRLPRCRGQRYGRPAWSILVHSRPRGADVAPLVTALVRGDDGVMRADLVIPEAAALELWFSNNDVYGCADWDSDFGANFALPIGEASGRAELLFALGADPRLSGRLVTSGLLELVYDPARLHIDCAWPGGGAPPRVSGVAAWRFLPGGQTGELDLFATGAVDRASARLQVPHNADALEVWFRGEDGEGCEVWDSRFGQNHRFDVSPAGVAPPTIGWVGGWNRWRARNCRLTEGLEDPVRYNRSSAGNECMAIGARVWVPGLTDLDGRPDAILAEVVTDLGFGGGPLAEPEVWPLTFAGRVGNDYRFRWELAMRVGMSQRGDYRFKFRFSTDGGATWAELGEGDEAGGDFRTLRVRNDSLDSD